MNKLQEKIKELLIKFVVDDDLDDIEPAEWEKPRVKAFMKELEQLIQSEREKALDGFAEILFGVGTALCEYCNDTGRLYGLEGGSPVPCETENHCPYKVAVKALEQYKTKLKEGK